MRRGTKHSEETKRKIGEARKGQPWKNKIGHSEETKEKLRELSKGRIHTEETKQKLRQINLGKKHSEESKQKMREIKKSGLSGETRRKISEAKKGRKHTEEHKRKLSEAHKGGRSYLWKGGKSFEPYGVDFNKELKEIIRNRDKRKCQICGKTELEESKKLSVHHIDYNKQNNNHKNLIALCTKCHIKTNDNRNYWTNYLQNNTMDYDDIDRFNDGLPYPDLTEEEQKALEEQEEEKKAGSEVDYPPYTAYSKNTPEIDKI